MSTQRFLRSRATRSTAALVLAGALGAVALNPASAALIGGNGTTNQLTLVGSDTTQEVMGVIGAQYNADRVANPDPDRTINDTTSFIGSTAGKTALASAAAAGRRGVDIARSSSPRSTTDPATFEYYAFARDAVSWNHTQVPTGPKKPVNLTLAQLRNIYDCTFTNWNQVGGPTLGIKRYIPQSGSGTRSFFLSNVLGFDPTTISRPGCPAVNQALVENDATKVPAADRFKAILAFSASQWIAQGNNAVNPDLRAGSTMGAINGISPVSGTAPNFTPTVAAYGESSTFAGARYVYNVIDTRTPEYTAARQFVGFISTTRKSKLCDGGYATQIRRFGFLPLPKISGLACRRS